MTTDQYLAAIARCRRVAWQTAGRAMLGYCVRRATHGIAIVPDYVLADPIAVADLARRSTARRLRGWIVRKENEIDPVENGGTKR